MSIRYKEEFLGIQKVSKVVALTLKQMRDYARSGMTTKQLDDYGARLLSSYGARSAPYLTYGFPGCTCISVNKEFCHGIPSARKILKEGDLINIDVSAELNGYWADNGGSFVLGYDRNQYQPLVNASKEILKEAIGDIRHGIRISQIGGLIEAEAARRGYSVVRNLGGHGVGRSLHEQPDELLNYEDISDKRRFTRNLVVAIETFISTDSDYAIETDDGWTLIGNEGGFMAQHEHTIIITDNEPVILTEMNEI